ncbi:PPIL6 protein, partial [Amia calva]|nr:PPIL6 protein [Amia calva]
MDAALRLEVVGLMKKPNFHIAKCTAEALKQRFPASFSEPAVCALLECAWHHYLNRQKRQLKGEVWQYSSSVMCFLNGELLGNEKDLKIWAENQWKFSFFRPQALYLALAEDFYCKHLQSTKHTFVYMDVTIGEKTAGRLLFELFTDLCPKTSTNFQTLCTGEAGESLGNLHLSYKGSIFHRIVSNGWIQGGDISPGGKGNGGESIYGPTFEDESFAVSHNNRGILGMANKGPHTNGSQFYITLQPAAWMDRKYVAFGQVIEGTEVLEKLEAVPTYNERPKQECKVIDCGVFVP